VLNNKIIFKSKNIPKINEIKKTSQNIEPAQDVQIKSWKWPRCSINRTSMVAQRHITNNNILRSSS
jgi:hypothetical protein